MALVRLTHKISGHGHLSNKQRIKYSSLRLIRGAVLLGRAGQSILDIKFNIYRQLETWRALQCDYPTLHIRLDAPLQVFPSQV